MKTLMILLLCHTATAVTHSLMDFVTGSSGLQNVSEFFGVLAVDGVSIIYCDSSNKIIEPRQDWMKLLFENSTEQEYTNLCFVDQPVTFRNLIQEFMQYLNHSGAHFLQRNSGCQWDENTGEVTGTAEFGYDGEGFLAFDIKTLTYFALKPEAIILQHQWNSEIPLIKKTEEILKRLCPDQLKLFLSYGKSSLQRKVLPSVSLLQKTPSSPVSCHATGFYPDRAAIFWRKDGEEIHEGVDPGDILPNNDDTFQMSVDLNILSVTPEDWRRYDCVFQLSGVSEDIITKLNKTIIKTNWVNNKTHIDAELPIIIAAFVLVFILIVAIGIVAYKKKKESHPAPSPSVIIELDGRSGTESPDSAQRFATQSPDSAQRLATESPDSAQKLATESPDSAQKLATESPDSAQRLATESPDSAQS